jgi:UDP-GlcNAc3NAcA epimerase
VSRRLRFVTVVGARPQFVKAAVVSRAIRVRHDEIIVHTGQHYDREMSAVFFDEMDIARPDVQLASGSGSHGEQTAAMLVGLERVLAEQQPDWVVLFGDTNSTLAGGLAASKLHLKVAHVEAGLRSYNRRMPEEVNRVLVDHVSTALLCPSDVAVENLAREGIRTGVHVVGDVMAEAFARTAEAVRGRSAPLDAYGVTDKAYSLMTLHRAENTDDPERLRGIVRALNQAPGVVLFPAHPRTQKTLAALGWGFGPNVRLLPPQGYLDMVRLLIGARQVLTDSGGLQKEAYWAHVPCITLRDETEWVETVETGWNTIVGADTDRIVAAMTSVHAPVAHPELYGSMGVASRCVTVLEEISAS